MLSAIIPAYITEQNKGKIMPLLSECIASIRGCDELVVQFDINGEGFAKTLNKGVLRASGDYIALINDDTKMLNGNLKEMCHKGKIVRPKLIGGDLAKFSFVVMERAIWDDVGGMDENFKVGFYEDDDWIDRAKAKGYEFLDSPFEVYHYGGATIQDIKGDFERKNKEYYENKREKRKIINYQ
jgi:GT2 family glycosyltransferase